MSLKQIEALLQKTIGLQAASLGGGAIETAVRARLGQCRVPDASAYAVHLDEHPEELSALIEEIVVRETWFFREAAAFDLLRERFLTRSNGAAPFRVLSLPCATGEEAYSVTMTLLEVAGLRTFEVCAVDVSTRALELAERATYGKSSFRGEQPGYSKYFEPAFAGLRLIEDVRTRVRFSRGNVLDTTLFAGATFDAVFCRNLLIYLEPAARLAALENLARLMREDAVLFAGHSEASELIGAGYRKVGPANAFAFEKPSAAAKARPERVPPSQLSTSTLRAGVPPADARRKHRPTPHEGTRPPSSRSSGRVARVLQLKAAAKAGATPLATALPVLDEPASSAVDCFANARLLADRGELVAAQRACEAQLSAAGPSAQGLCLLGLVKKAAGDHSGALVCFGKALYLDPGCHEALVHSALIEEHAGHQAEARKLRARAERVLRKGDA